MALMCLQVSLRPDPQHALSVCRFVANDSSVQYFDEMERGGLFQTSFVLVLRHGPTASVATVLGSIAIIP